MINSTFGKIGSRSALYAAPARLKPAVEARLLQAIEKITGNRSKAEFRKSFSRPLPRGINWDWFNKSWQAYIYIAGKKIAIARCKKEADAQKARIQAEEFVRKHLMKDI